MTSVIFDLDGTLVDSAPDIRAAINRLLAAEGRAPLDLATITAFIGNGLPKLVERVIAHTGMEMAEHARLSAEALRIYEGTPSRLSRLYPGVAETLAALRGAGHRLGICTNKPHGPALKLLAEMGLGDCFEVVVGGDSTDRRKPDPLPLLTALRRLGGGPALYVGDSEIDAETAQRAGVAFALFTEGYRKRPVSEIVHDAAFSEFAALPAIVQAHFGAAD